DLGDAREGTRRSGGDPVHGAKDDRPLDLLRDLEHRAARKAQAEEPAHDEDREGRESGTGDRVRRGVDAGAQDLAPYRLADRKSDARPEAAADHENQHGAQWPSAGVVDLEVIEDIPR